jgi:hypothetical protein
MSPVALSEYKKAPGHRRTPVPIPVADAATISNFRFALSKFPFPAFIGYGGPRPYRIKSEGLAKLSEAFVTQPADPKLPELEVRNMDATVV